VALVLAVLDAVIHRTGHDAAADPSTPQERARVPGTRRRRPGRRQSSRTGRRPAKQGSDA
jgi:hypothetical protein